MAALCISHSFHIKDDQNQTQEVRSRSYPRFLKILSCHEGGSNPRKGYEIKEEEEEKRGSKEMLLLPRVLMSVEKMGKGLKERLSPQKKGDMKDLVLMSLSFAVYVYISQQIVCAYFVWMSMPKPSW